MAKACADFRFSLFQFHGDGYLYRYCKIILCLVFLNGQFKEKHNSRLCNNVHMYTGCPRRNVPDFGRVFLMLKYTDITQNTYIQS